MYEYLFKICLNFTDLFGEPSIEEYTILAKDEESAKVFAKLDIENKYGRVNDLLITVNPVEVSENIAIRVLNRLTDVQASWAKYVENLGNLDNKSKFFKVYKDLSCTEFLLREHAYYVCQVQYGIATFELLASSDTFEAKFDCVRIDNFVVKDSKVYTRE